MVLPPGGGDLARVAQQGGEAEMQTRRTTPDHHHQDGFKSTGLACSSPEGELIALARSKHQVLTEPTLRLIRETLELNGVSLATFVADVRPHFRNNILNPSGFLINRARCFHQVSRPARVSFASGPIQPADDVCEGSKGEKYVMEDHEIRPCSRCSTPESRRQWEMKEGERAKKAQLSAREGFRRLAADDALKHSIYKTFNSVRILLAAQFARPAPQAHLPKDPKDRFLEGQAC
jgi:hypothetical protein